MMEKSQGASGLEGHMQGEVRERQEKGALSGAGNAAVSRAVMTTLTLLETTGEQRGGWLSLWYLKGTALAAKLGTHCVGQEQKQEEQ